MTVQTAYFAAMLIMSVVSFVAMGSDKSKAQRGARRTSEKRLFLYALLLGAPGGTLGMFAFRHKTRHWYFRIGFPLLAAVQAAGIWLL